MHVVRTARDRGSGVFDAKAAQTERPQARGSPGMCPTAPSYTGDNKSRCGLRLTGKKFESCLKSIMTPSAVALALGDRACPLPTLTAVFALEFGGLGARREKQLSRIFAPQNDFWHRHHKQYSTADSVIDTGRTMRQL